MDKLYAGLSLFLFAQFPSQFSPEIIPCPAPQPDSATVIDQPPAICGPEICGPGPGSIQNDTCGPCGPNQINPEIIPANPQVPGEYVSPLPGGYLSPLPSQGGCHANCLTTVKYEVLVEVEEEQTFCVKSYEIRERTEPYCVTRFDPETKACIETTGTKVIKYVVPVFRTETRRVRTYRPREVEAKINLDCGKPVQDLNLL